MTRRQQLEPPSAPAPERSLTSQQTGGFAVPSGVPGTQADLGSNVRRSLGWSFLNNILNRLGSVVASVVLARILAPETYGVFAAALVVLSAILSVNELGVSLAVVRWPGRVDEIAPTVSFISIASSVTLYAACFALAPYVASALNAPSAVGLIRVLCVCVLADGVAAVPAALITREFQQRKRMIIDLCSFVFGSCLSVGLAVAGFGAWSMVWGFLISNLLAGALSIAWSPARYRPGWDRRAAKSLLAFGLPLAGSSLLIFFILNFDYIVVGHLLGVKALGLYLLAFNLSSWPANLVSASVRRVSLAGFSRLAEQPSQIGQSLARAFGLVLAVALPMATVLACYARPLISLAYGPDWAAAADVLSLLCVLGTARVLTELTYDFLVAVGRTHVNFWLQALWGACLLPALVLGARWHGTVGVAVAHAIVAVFVMIPAYLLVLHWTGIDIRPILANCARPVTGCLLIVTSAFFVMRTVPGPVAQVLAGGLAAVALYLIPVLPMRRLLRTSDLLVPAPSQHPIT